MSPSGGDAYVYGESIRDVGGMNTIRSIMGVCPQFDVLYDNLTGREHLRLFAEVKGVPRSSAKVEIANLLEQVPFPLPIISITPSLSG